MIGISSNLIGQTKLKVNFKLLLKIVKSKLGLQNKYILSYEHDDIEHRF